MRRCCSYAAPTATCSSDFAADFAVDAVGAATVALSLRLISIQAQTDA